MIYYTSDLHLGSNNIIKYEYRPFPNRDVMDEALIANWNQTVQPDDHIYILGDFCFRGATKAIAYLERLVGHKHLLAGNHDAFLQQDSWGDYLISVTHVETHGAYCTIKDGEHQVVLCHYPILHWEGREQGSLHLYGHVHSYRDTSMMYANSYHVGTDAHNYRPVTLQELLSGV